MIQSPKGTRDYLPEEMKKRRWVMDKIREVFERYGYSEICTPAFESLELLEKKGGIGDENVKDIYRFQDKSNRWLGLRFEVTASVARIVSGNPSLTKPIKWYYITNLWRYEATKKGRQREFWQAGIENIGKKDEVIDAEILAVTYDSLKAVGIENFVIKIGSRHIISKVADRFGVKNKNDFFRLIDKREKMPESDWLMELKKQFGKESEMKEFLRLAGMPWPEAKKELSAIAKEDIEYLEKILGYCKNFGIDKKNIKVDLMMIRGLDYYTNFIFETEAEGFKELGSVAGGGRYDKLIELFGGQPTPATGMGIGIERIMEIVMGEIKEKPAVDVLILPVGEEFKKYAVELASRLRRGGIYCDIEVMRDKFRKKMAYASELGVGLVAIIGKEEAEKGQVTLKDMETGDQKTFYIKNLIEELGN